MTGMLCAVLAGDAGILRQLVKHRAEARLNRRKAAALVEDPMETGGSGVWILRFFPL